MMTTRWKNGLAAAIALAAQALQAAPVLSLLPSRSSLDPGALLDVELRVSGIDASTPQGLLGAFDLSVLYDAAVLAPRAAPFSAGSSLGDPLDPLQTLYGADPAVAGVLRLFGISLLETAATDCVFCTGPFLADLQSGSVLLGTLHFQVMAGAPRGLSGLVAPAAQAVLGSAGGELLLVGQDAEAAFRVPEPAGLPLLALALLAACLAGGTARRRPAVPR